MGKSVFLTGFMGAGKSTIGRELSVVLNWPFIDLDRRIENEQKMSIAALFSKKGEKEFRRIEMQTLASLVSGKNQVIALGGGTLLRQETRLFVLSSGLLIHLQVSAEQLQKRLERDSGKRPLLKGLRGKALKAHIQQLLKDRESIYAAAPYAVSTDRDTVSEIVSAIRKILEKELMR